MSASTSRKSLATRRLARSRNSGIGLDGSVRRKKSATASSARIASWRDSITPPADPPALPPLAARPPAAAAAWPAAPAARDRPAIQLRELRRQRLEVGRRRPDRLRSRIRASMLFSDASALGDASCRRAVSSASGIAANAARIAASSAFASSGPGRGLAARNLDVPQAEGPCCRLRNQRQPPQPVDDRHRVGETVQRVAPQHGVLVERRIDLTPVGLEPLRRHVVSVSENAGNPSVLSSAVPRYASRRRSLLFASASIASSRISIPFRRPAAWRLLVLVVGSGGASSELRLAEQAKRVERGE